MLFKFEINIAPAEIRMLMEKSEKEETKEDFYQHILKEVLMKMSYGENKE